MNNNTKKNNNFSNYSHAPYNFIPLSKRIIKRYNSIKDLPGHDEIVEGTLSGEITYTIENITDLIVSDGNERFFKDTKGNYAIPGSTIRGKLRSNIGTLGFSAVGEDIQDEKFLYRRFASKSSNLNQEYKARLGMKMESVAGNQFAVLQNVKAGYIKRINEDEYVIMKSKTIKGKTYFRISEEHLSSKLKGMKGINLMYNRFGKLDNSYEPYLREISFNINEKNNLINDIGEVGKLKNTGYILGSGAIFKKKSHYIVNEIDNSDIIRISDLDIRAYKKYYTKDKKSNLNKSGFYSLPEKNGDMKPVFYAEYKGRVYFGFTPYLRLFYDESIQDGIPSCHKEEVLDYKKAIFGFANTDNSYKSRISVEDAVCIGKPRTKIYDMVLGEPKATCVQLYLKQDGDRNSLHSYNGEFEIRGVKYYWLKKDVMPMTAASNNVNCKEEAISKGANFKGKISFNNLYEDELGLLLWSLYIHKDANQNIGKGKPYGFGNIKFKDITVKVDNIQNKYTDIFADFSKEIDIKEYINKYQEFAKNKFKDIKNIQEDLSIKTFIEVHKNDTRQEKVTYMDLKDFTSYSPLPTPLKVLGLEKETVNRSMQGSKYNSINNTRYNETKTTSSSKGTQKSSKKSVYIDRDESAFDNGFGALKDFFK